MAGGSCTETNHTAFACKDDLPEIAVNINGDLGVKDWRSDPANGKTQRFTLAEKREVARRTNYYPSLIAALKVSHQFLHDNAPEDDASLYMVSCLLKELGEAE